VIDDGSKGVVVRLKAELRRRQLRHFDRTIHGQAIIQKEGRRQDRDPRQQVGAQGGRWSHAFLCPTGMLQHAPDPTGLSDACSLC
jgi:hypothetical protein